MGKKTIKIKFVDFWPSFNVNDNFFVSILSKNFDLELSDNPDYIFYSCFGNDFLKYNCVRIFWAGECITPDFNLCDYAVGFDHIAFEDRYCRLPLYAYGGYAVKYEMAKHKHEKASEIANQQRDFCSMVVSGVTGREKRKEIYDLLSEYKSVASGGRWMNNVGGPVKDKLDFCSHYKFNIAFENCSYSGYTTEKIVEAFASGTVPIYFGDPNIENEFNPKAFVNCSAFSSLAEAVEYIIYLDTHNDAYEAMLREPIELYEKDFGFAEFLNHIFSQEYVKAYRRPSNLWVKRVEENAHHAETEQKIENSFLGRVAFCIYRKRKR